MFDHDAGAADPRHVLGVLAENHVAEYLEGRGYAIVERNARVGRLEIDIVARRGDTMVFCEVRARRTADFLHPLATIGPAKVERVRRAAQLWLRAHPGGGRTVRFDAAGVTFEGPIPALEYVEDAF